VSLYEELVRLWASVGGELVHLWATLKLIDSSDYHIEEQVHLWTGLRKMVPTESLTEELVRLWTSLRKMVPSVSLTEEPVRLWVSVKDWFFCEYQWRTGSSFSWQGSYVNRIEDNWFLLWAWLKNWFVSEPQWVENYSSPVSNNEERASLVRIDSYSETGSSVSWIEETWFICDPQPQGIDACVRRTFSSVSLTEDICSICDPQLKRTGSSVICES